MFGITGAISGLMNGVALEENYKKRCAIAEQLGFPKPERPEPIPIVISKTEEKDCSTTGLIGFIIGLIIGKS